MKIERITLKNFRCFGPQGTTVNFERGITGLVGGNGAGKTALLQAVSRIYGVTSAQRRVQSRDFHLPPDRKELQSGDHLSIDVVFSFPELAGMRADQIGDAVPEFFHQIAASAPGQHLIARALLKATWTDDGTPGGDIEEDLRWVTTLGDDFEWEECKKVPAVERSAVQLVYVPATRNAQEQVTSLLKGRLWQAARWSAEFRQASQEAATRIQEAFQDENPARFVLDRLESRWRQLHDADTDTTPILRLVENRFEEFVRRADFAFRPDEAGQERALSDLSDGQRSLFHIALTAATLEVERDAFTGPAGAGAFDQEKLPRAHLTLLAIEEPENSLSPFFLSRIIAQARDISLLSSAQVVLSSHSAAILSRIEPEEVRYFRLDRQTRQSSIRRMTLPENDIDAANYVRLAVRAYPELYFARFVILAEGDSEQLILPRVAEAMGVALDPSFVPIVPLGGRYCTHFWRLLSDLQIPYATLLDFDIGRSHGGANLIRTVDENLTAIGVDLGEGMQFAIENIDINDLDELTDDDIWITYEDNHWVKALEEKGVFLSDPLDLDFSMLMAFSTTYMQPHPGGQGPRATANALQSAKDATLKAGGDSTLYGSAYDEEFRWYPYLFLHRSKPEAHLSALARIAPSELADDAPSPLKSLILHVKAALGLVDDNE